MMPGSEMYIPDYSEEQEETKDLTLEELLETVPF